jgi:carbonic anhydrase
MAAIAGVTTLTVFAASSCGNSDNSDNRANGDIAKPNPASVAKSAATKSDEKPAGAHWSYEGGSGPANWATLEEDFEKCQSGHEQSPVDLTEDHSVEAEKGIAVDYEPVTAELVNNGHSVQANVSAGSKIVIDGIAYDLKQFHFHLPSEHTEDGRSAAMELHFVHADKQGKLAVLGVLMDEKAGASAFGNLWKEFPAKEGGTAEITQPIDLTKFLPGSREQYRYTGSLTTPPCTEGVKWAILKDSVPVSPEQVAQYKKMFTKTNRPIQSLNDRKLDHFGD